MRSWSGNASCWTRTAEEHAEESTAKERQYLKGQAAEDCRTLQALPLILGPARKADADYLDACRIKRNTVEYDYAGAATRKDAQELIEFTRELRQAVLAWLEREHIELTLPGDKQ